MAELLAIFSQHLNRKITVLIIGLMTKDQVLACFATPNNCLALGTIIVWKGYPCDLGKSMTQPHLARELFFTKQLSLLIFPFSLNTTGFLQTLTTRGVPLLASFHDRRAVRWRDHALDREMKFDQLVLVDNPICGYTRHDVAQVADGSDLRVGFVGPQPSVQGHDFVEIKLAVHSDADR